MSFTQKLLQTSQTNPRVAELIERNQMLIQSSNFILKEYKTEMTLNPPRFPIQISGEIRKNGFLYAETECRTMHYHSKLNWKVNFASPYVQRLVGRMDFLGNLQLDVEEFSYSFPFPKRSTQFKCAKNDAGEVIFVANTIETQMSRNEITTHLIGDPFGKDDRKRNEFLTNREELLTYI
jgi:hypothetical protein